MRRERGKWGEYEGGNSAVVREDTERDALSPKSLKSSLLSTLNSHPIAYSLIPPSSHIHFLYSSFTFPQHRHRFSITVCTENPLSARFHSTLKNSPPPTTILSTSFSRPSKTHPRPDHHTPPPPHPLLDDSRFLWTFHDTPRGLRVLRWRAVDGDNAAPKQRREKMLRSYRIVRTIGTLEHFAIDFCNCSNTKL